MNGQYYYFLRRLALQNSGPSAPPVLRYFSGDIVPTGPQSGFGRTFSDWPNSGSLGNLYDLHTMPGEGTASYSTVDGPNGVRSTLLVAGFDRLFTSPDVPITGAAPRGFAFLARPTLDNANDFWAYGTGGGTESNAFGMSANFQGELIINLYYIRIPTGVSYNQVLPYSPDGITLPYLSITGSTEVVQGQFVVKWKATLGNGVVLANGIDNSNPASIVDTHATPFCMGNGVWAGRGYQLSVYDFHLYDYAISQADQAAIRRDWNIKTGLNF